MQTTIARTRFNTAVVLRWMYATYQWKELKQSTRRCKKDQLVCYNVNVTQTAINLVGKRHDNQLNMNDWIVIKDNMQEHHSNQPHWDLPQPSKFLELCNNNQHRQMSLISSFCPNNALTCCKFIDYQFPRSFEFHILLLCKIGVKRPGKMLQIASSPPCSFDEHLPLYTLPTTSP